MIKLDCWKEIGDDTRYRIRGLIKQSSDEDLRLKIVYLFRRRCVNIFQSQWMLDPSTRFLRNIRTCVCMCVICFNEVISCTRQIHGGKEKRLEAIFFQTNVSKRKIDFLCEEHLDVGFEQ